jgi:UDP-glucose 4-epimerase
MRVLVAGGAGFIGSWTVQALLERGHQVTVLDNLISGQRGNLSTVAENLEFLDVDIRDHDAVMNLAGPLDSIVHLAFPTPLCNREIDKQFHDIASTGTANLLELALARDAYLVYGSSISVYGRQEILPISEDNPVAPMLVYGANKLLGEYLCSAFSQVNDLRWSALRISDAYGPRDRRSNAVNNFLAAARQKDAIHIKGSGDQKRSYTYVSDIAKAISMVVERPLDNEVANVTTDEAVSINQLAQFVKEDYCPELEITHDNTVSDSRDYVFSNKKFTNLAGLINWTPLRQGLAQTNKHYT